LVIVTCHQCPWDENWHAICQNSRRCD